MLVRPTALEAMIGGLGVWELVIILLIVLLFVGGRKLPELAGSIGKSVRTFKRAVSGTDEEPVDVTPADEADSAKPALEKSPEREAQTVEVESSEAEHKA
jgi:sec-independent protein translocase protein TatA